MTNSSSIIDFHSHLAYRHVYCKEYIDALFKTKSSISDEKLLDKILSLFMNDKDGILHLKQMRKANISHSVVLMIDSGFGTSYPLLSLDSIYELHYELSKSSNGRFSIFAGVDPRRGKDGFSLFQKGINEYGFTGMKLYPPMGFEINDEALYPYYKLCQEKGIPVVIHTGPSLDGETISFRSCSFMIEIIRAFPMLNVILAHAGLYINQREIQDLIKFPGVYVDISGYQRNKQIYLSDGKFSINKIFNPEFNFKILFGTDWPLFNIMNTLSDNINDFLAFAKLFTDDKQVISNILYDNAKRILV